MHDSSVNELFITYLAHAFIREQGGGGCEIWLY
jgi:hypothetical protein